MGSDITPQQVREALNVWSPGPQMPRELVHIIDAARAWVDLYEECEHGRFEAHQTYLPKGAEGPVCKGGSRREASTSDLIEALGLDVEGLAVAVYSAGSRAHAIETLTRALEEEK